MYVCLWPVICPSEFSEMTGPNQVNFGYVIDSAGFFLRVHIRRKTDQAGKSYGDLKCLNRHLPMLKYTFSRKTLYICRLAERRPNCVEKSQSLLY